MTSPRYEPRRYCTAPRLYGRVESLPWKTPQSRSDAERVAASRLQHAFAFAIRDTAERRHGSVSAFARAHDLPYENLARMLRGSVVLRLETIAECELVLGGGVYARAWTTLAAQNSSP